MKRLFELLLAARLLFPFFDSPLNHLYSDPQRHWDNGALFSHPNIMGSNDPYLYQAWLSALRWIANGNTPVIMLGCGILCAAMPIGWYRALRELLPETWALGGAIVIALLPESISIYAYFMNETLLMALLGMCFWLTLRCWRKQTLGAYALVSLAWVCAALTRTAAVPMALGCLGWLWLIQTQRPQKLLIASAIACALMVPAGLHAQRNLHYFTPFGNLYFNSIYHDSGTHDIAVDYGPLGSFQFGAPSFYGPTYYPFSDWTTDRKGIAHISINTAHGREDWKRERTRILALRTFPLWRQRWEDLQYLLFGQEWPNTNTSTFLGLATLWGRWIWPAVLLLLMWAFVRRWFIGRAWLLPVCGLGTIGLLALQTQGVTEARFRLPIDALLVAAAICAVYFRLHAGQTFRPSAAVEPATPGVAHTDAAASAAERSPPSLPARD